MYNLAIFYEYNFLIYEALMPILAYSLQHIYIYNDHIFDYRHSFKQLKLNIFWFRFLGHGQYNFLESSSNCLNMQSLVSFFLSVVCLVFR